MSATTLLFIPKVKLSGSIGHFKKSHFSFFSKVMQSFRFAVVSRNSMAELHAGVIKLRDRGLRAFQCVEIPSHTRLPGFQSAP